MIRNLLHCRQSEPKTSWSFLAALESHEANAEHPCCWGRTAGAPAADMELLSSKHKGLSLAQPHMQGRSKVLKIKKKLYKISFQIMLKVNLTFTRDSGLVKKYPIPGPNRVVNNLVLPVLQKKQNMPCFQTSRTKKTIVINFKTIFF